MGGGVAAMEPAEAADRKEKQAKKEKRKKERKRAPLNLGAFPVPATGAAPLPPHPNSKRRRDELSPASESADKAKRRAEAKKAKRAKVLAVLQVKGSVPTPGLSARPFDTDETDHCETPFAAYRDIEPFLFRLAQSLGKTKDQLRIYGIRSPFLPFRALPGTFPVLTPTVAVQIPSTVKEASLST